MIASPTPATAKSQNAGKAGDGGRRAPAAAGAAPASRGAAATAIGGSSNTTPRRAATIWEPQSRAEEVSGPEQATHVRSNLKALLHQAHLAAEEALNDETSVLGLRGDTQSIPAFFFSPDLKPGELWGRAVGPFYSSEKTAALASNGDIT